MKRLPMGMPILFMLTTACEKTSSHAVDLFVACDSCVVSYATTVSGTLVVDRNWRLRDDMPEGSTATLSLCGLKPTSVRPALWFKVDGTPAGYIHSNECCISGAAEVQ
ncbi:MAG: hypothetical protein JNM31_09850 [Flavobacteriales bacterium]|nr:hypothetical protein [Flavobacteriales bacterium]